jgi:hypothetical protein
MVTITPLARDGFEINPGRGWMLMMPGAEPEQFANWPWVSMVYYRVAWKTLEPEEGRLNWSDARWEGDFKRWTEKGYPVGLDVMCCNPHSDDAWCTPKWVHDAGCKGHMYRRDSGDPMAHGKIMDRWEPDYDDPIFKEKLESFLTAFAARYDNDPDVDFVTLRAYAPWGEWWGLETSEETLNWMVDLHLRLFKHTPLTIPVSNWKRWEPVIKPAVRKGIGIRKDGLGGPVEPMESELCDMAHWRAPVMLEFYGPRSYLREKGWDTLFDKEECIYGWHASRVNMGFVGQARQWVEHEPDFLDRAAKRMGYRFRIREANYTETVSRGEKFAFGAWWRNEGVAPYTRRGALLLILRDGAGRETVIHKDDKLPNSIWMIGHYRGEYQIDLPASIAPGEYTLLVAMEDYFKGRTNIIRMAHEDDETGRVTVGKVTLMA